MSHPLPPYIPRLGQLDRQIFESCDIAGSKTLIPHLDKGGPARHLTVQYIMNRAKCTAQEAEHLADSCVSLEATKKMVDTFCDGARKNGAKRVIQYLWKFVLGVTEAEAPSDEHEPWEDTEVVAGELEGGIFGQHGICEDSQVEDIVRPEKEGPMATIVDNKLQWIADIARVGTGFELTVHEDNEDNSASGTYIAYHVLDDFNPSEEKPWLERQPKSFLNKLAQIKSCKTLKDLSNLAKESYSNNDFSRAQAGVFWTEYNSQKHKLEPKHLGATARSWLTKIIQSNGHLGSFGVFLHKVQEGTIKVTPAPTQEEWGVIWDTYKRRKKVTAAVDTW